METFNQCMESSVDTAGDALEQPSESSDVQPLPSRGTWRLIVNIPGHTKKMYFLPI